jgi:hypothetical protein
MRFFIRLTIIGLALAGVMLLIAPREWFPTFYAPRFMGIGAYFFILLILLPQLLFGTKKLQHQQSIVHLQFSLAVTLVLCGLGEFGLWQLYRYGFEYDKFIHFLMPAVVTYSMVHFLMKRFEFRLSSASTLGGVIIFFCGVVWEYAEFYNDKVFGTQLFGIYGADVYRDTALDLFFNACGVIAALLVIFFSRRHRS